MENQILQVKDLTVKIGNSTILENINLSVNEGEVVAIVGPNGGGKTTFVKTCLGFVKPSSGYVRLLGKKPREAIKTGKIGYLPQKSSTPKKFPVSALDVVLFGLVNTKLPKKKKIEKALEYLDKVGMIGFKDKHYGSLSGGQQQRVSIARVLVSEPKIIFLDEPATGIDVLAQESFYEFLKQLKQEGMTIVMVTHDIGSSAKFVDKIAGLNRYLHFYGHPKEFFHKDILKKLYGSEMELIIHSEECVACEHFRFKIGEKKC